MVYFLLVGKCGTHQAALSAKSGVIGRAAAAAAKEAGESMDLEGVTANAVRLFKYLVPDYYEDLKRSTEAWVCKTVDVVPRAACQPHAAAGQLQAVQTSLPNWPSYKLYTQSMLYPMSCWSCGLTALLMASCRAAFVVVIACELLLLPVVGVTIENVVDDQ